MKWMQTTQAITQNIDILKEKGVDQSARLNEFNTINTGKLTTQKYEYKDSRSKIILEAANFPKLSLIDSHEYATRLANLDSSHVLFIDGSYDGNRRGEKSKF